MAIFARTSSLVMLFEAHVCPSGQLARKGSVGGSTAVAAGSGGMPHALSELSPEDLHDSIQSTEKPLFYLVSNVQLERDSNRWSLLCASRAESSNFAAVVFHGNDRTQGADGDLFAPSRTCENVFRNRLSNVTVQDSS